jgi:hypothetical protein
VGEAHQAAPAVADGYVAQPRSVVVLEAR